MHARYMRFPSNPQNNSGVTYRYSQKCINKIISNISIVDVVGDLFIRPIQTKTKNRFFLNNSPFTYLSEPKGTRPFFCSTDRRRFKCFHTGLSGDVIGFVRKFLNLNKRDAITYLLIKYDTNSKMKDITEKKHKIIEYNPKGTYKNYPF